MSELKRPKRVSVVNLDKVAGKTYEDGVADERERIMVELIKFGGLIEDMLTYGKRRYRKALNANLSFLETIINTVDPKFFDEKLQDPQ